MSAIAQGTWVEIEKILLTPAERAPGLPEDTAGTPYVLRVSGFLAEAAVQDGPARITTLIGNTYEGRLRVVNPGYTHSFGATVPELLAIGRGGAR
jgi:2-amino-4-ketopentanoate thiolase alpha subunit